MRSIKFLLRLGFLLAVVVVSTQLQTYTDTVQAQDSRAQELIDMVNTLRAEHGLGLLNNDGYLVAACQQQTEWRVSSGNYITHEGPGGSRPKDRAVAAGYGDGAQIFASENIAYTGKFDVEKVVRELWNDDAHMNTMLNTQYVDVGAAVVEGGGFFHYTLLAAVIVGSPNPNTTQGVYTSTPAPGTGTPLSTSTTSTPFNPVLAATPMPDGSIVHIVKAGQAPYTIAVIYKITLDELYKLNNLDSNSLIYPNQKLIIRNAYTTTPSLPVTETPAATVIPHPSLQPTLTTSPSIETPTAMPPPASGSNSEARKIIGAILIAFSTIGALVLLISSIGTRARK